MFESYEDVFSATLAAWKIIDNFEHDTNTRSLSETKLA